MKIINKKKEQVVPKVAKTINPDNYGLDVISSIRLFTKNNHINLDCRIKPAYRVDNKERMRFSTGIVSTPRALQRVEREKFSLGIQYYLENNTIKDDVIFFKDLALLSIQEDSHNRTVSTQKEYISIYTREISPVFDDMRINDIKPSHIKVWQKNLLTKLSLSRARYIKYHRVLNFIFKYAFMEEYINKNVMDLVEIKSNLFIESTVDKSKQYDTKDEIKLMLDNAQGWFRVFLTILFSTGMRTGEAISLKFEDFDYENNTIHLCRSRRNGVTSNRLKTQSHATIRMSNMLKGVLQTYQSLSDTNEYLFTNLKTKKLFWGSGSIVKTYFKPLLKKLGIEYKLLYSTRSSYASLLSFFLITI